MTMVSLPNILFRVRAGKRLSDIEFLAIKDYGTDGTDSKRVDVNAETALLATTTETDTATQTANIGKDMYLASASFEITLTQNEPFDITMRLVVNGITVETIKRNQAALDVDFEYTFETKGVKVATGEIIKVTMQNGVDTGNTRSQAKVKLILWEENTGESPQIPSI